MTDLKPVYAILYQDKDVPPEIFAGEGARQAALATYAIRDQSWTCDLLGPVETWQPMTTVPKDGTPILLKCKPDIGHMSNIRFVGQYSERFGWRFAAPVGEWDIPFESFAGWMPVPD